MSEVNLKESIVSVGENAIEVIKTYFEGKMVEKDNFKVDNAFKMVSLATKVMHMNQHRVLVERGQALRLLSFLPDQKVRNAYIKLTNPQTVPLLEKK